tara:strand:- start:330 stop:1064 length:735 start_codon:yes stop_codon:yes gene_type:complete
MTSNEDLYELSSEQLLELARARFEAGKHSVNDNEASIWKDHIDCFERDIEKNNIYYWKTERMREVCGHFSPDNVKYRAEFPDKFVGERAAMYRAACKHYRTTGYYRHITNEAPQEFLDGDDEAYTPSPYYFEQLTQNKYFPKIWASQQSEPKYAPGDFICFRAKSALPLENPLISMIPWRQRDGLWQMKQFAGKAGFVIEVSPVQPKSAAKNSKIYKILLAGKTVPMYVEERHIKKGRLPKKSK